MLRLSKDVLTLDEKLKLIAAEKVRHDVNISLPQCFVKELTSVLPARYLCHSCLFVKASLTFVISLLTRQVLMPRPFAMVMRCVVHCGWLVVVRIIVRYPQRNYHL